MDQKAPTRWAADIRQLLRAVFGDEGFPVDVARIALELSHQWSPGDPISAVVGADLPGFDGALIPDPAKQKGWLILYNAKIESAGRIRFTIAHEFGHYLQHRTISPKGFRCSSEDFVRRDPAYRRLENEANAFAAQLLMPLDDYRRQIPDRAGVDFEVLGSCADRYGVSLVAGTLQWLTYTRKRAVLVLSREGFILWAWSSDSAWRSGLFVKTAGRPPIEVPADSLAGQVPPHSGERICAKHSEGVWFMEECQELLLPSERYDFSVSLLLFSDTLPDWEDQQANRALASGRGGLQASA